MADSAEATVNDDEGVAPPGGVSDCALGMGMAFLNGDSGGVPVLLADPLACVNESS